MKVIKKTSMSSNLVATLLTILSFSCSAENPNLEKLVAEVSSPGPFPIGVQDFTFVDSSRETPAHGELPAQPQRSLPTTIWYPTNIQSQEPIPNAPLNRESAPYPLIIFSHGFMANRKLYQEITQHLAKHGYIVVAPDYPLASSNSPGGPGMDLAHHPGDVSFIIDTIIELSENPQSFLAGGVNSKAIGLTGHSLGGGITVLTTFGTLADPRIKASAPLSPFDCFLEENYFATGGAPILYLSGERDIFTRFSDNLRRPYDFSPPPKYLGTITGGTHLGFTDLPDFPETSDLFSIFYSMKVDPQMIQGFSQLMEATGGNFLNCTQMFSSSEELESLPALSFSRQREIARTLLTAFFHVYLKGKKTYQALLETNISALIPELTLESDLE